MQHVYGRLQLDKRQFQQDAEKVVTPGTYQMLILKRKSIISQFSANLST